MPDDKPSKPSPPATRGHRFIKSLIALVLVAFLGALLWTTYLNWHKDGRFSFRIFDTGWWRPGIDSAQPALNGARSAAAQANDALWGDGGMVDQAARWWNGKLETRGKAAPDKPVATPTTKSDEVKRCERAIADAEVDFQLGLDHYRLANPHEGQLGEQRRSHLRDARGKFLSVKDLLTRSLGPYEADAGHDPDRLSDAKALLLYNDRLLASLDRLLEVP